jgi:hypothetical protein
VVASCWHSAGIDASLICAQPGPELGAAATGTAVTAAAVVTAVDDSGALVATVVEEPGGAPGAPLDGGAGEVTGAATLGPSSSPQALRPARQASPTMLQRPKCFFERVMPK